MAVKAQTADTLAATVQNDLRSPSTTSPATLNLLRALLGFDLVAEKKTVEATKKAVVHAPISRKTSTAQKPKPRPAKTKTTSQFAIYETPESSLPSLAVEKRRKLATESFNTSLKHLSDATKLQRREVCGQESGSRREARSPPRKETNILQNRSPNRQKEEISPEKVVTKIGLSGRKGVEHLEAIADCARTSLRCLEDLEAPNESNTEANLHLENGSLILLDKLATLSLKDRALLEADHLHTRLQRLLKPSQKTLAAPSNSSVRVEDQCRQLWDNLQLDGVPTNAELLKLVVSCQYQFLQVGALLGPAFIHGNLINRLGSDQPRSPCRVILHGLQSGLMTAEKAGQRLHNLSQSISRLCGVAKDVSGGEKCSPKTLFNLQYLLLDIRCRSWKPLKHLPDLDREIWSVLNRAIGQYCANIKEKQCLDFSTLLGAAKGVQSVLHSEGFDSHTPLAVANNLAELAQTAGHDTDALALLEALDEAIPKLQGLARVIQRCKIACIRLHHAQDDLESTLGVSHGALELLQRPPKGSAADLNDLLLHCARLRKAALTVVADVEKLVGTGDLTDLHLRLQTCAVRLTFAILRFILRFLDSKPAQRTQKDDVTPAARIPAAVLSSAERCIDAAFTSAKLPSANSILLHDETEAALQDCVSLAMMLEGTSQGICVKVSHSLWLAYLEGRRTELPQRTLLGYLEKSVAVLTGRPVVEQRKALRATKLERLARLHMDMANHMKARALLQDAVEFYIKFGTLTQAVEIVLHQPKHSAWDDSTTECYALSGCLRSFIRCSEAQHSLTPYTEFFHDDPRLPASHRAISLEYQLLQALEMRVEISQDHLRTTITQILDLYQGRSYHFCRLRFMRDLLKCHSRNGELLASDFLAGLMKQYLSDNTIDNGSTVFLASYGPVLQATVRIQYEFLQGRPEAERFEECVEAINSRLLVCHDKTELEIACDDPAVVLNQLQAIADYAGMLYLPLLQHKTLDTLLKVLRLCVYETSEALPNCLARLGDLQSRMGRSVDAGRSFAAAEEAMKDSSDAHVHLNWSLAYAGYLLDLNSLQKCSKTLESAREAFENNLPEQGHQELSKSRSSHLYLGHASFVASKLALKEGDLANAVLLARRCIKSTTAVWTSLEKHWTVNQPQEAAVNETTLHNTSMEMSETSMSVDKAASRSNIKGAAFWSYVDLHFQALLHVSSLAAHNGMYQDAVHYAGQAEKLAASISSGTRTALARAALVVLHGKCGQDQLTRQLLSTSQSDELRWLSDLEVARCRLHEATASFALQEYESARSSLARARHIVRSINQSTKSPTAKKDADVELEQSMTKLTVKDRTTRTQISRKAPKNQNSGTMTTAKRGAKSAATLSTHKQHSSKSPLLSTLEDAMFVMETELELQGYASDESSAPESLDTATMSSGGRDVVLASALLSRAFKLFASDAVHCVLAETAIAMPSQHKSRRPSSRLAVLPGASPAVKKGHRSGQIARIAPKAQSPDINQPQALLRAAHEMLVSSAESRRSVAASSILHAGQKLLARLSLLSSAVEVSIEHSPARVIWQSLEPKDIMMKRDRMAIEAERATDVKSLPAWPQIAASELRSMENQAQSGTVPTSTLVQELPNLPPSWSVVCIELNDDCSEFFVSRISHGSTPFLLRIPLSRSSGEDDEAADFSFPQAKQELLEIVAAANSSAHDPRAQADKQTRKKWWSERESLDRQLALLLRNIEEVWFGGFRGILSQAQMTDNDRISRFAESLSQSLDNHLPSRQRSSNTRRSKIQLHAHVLRLFLALGHPDHSELDDSVTDLLYFVVDILQFDGECNAYDEIDFDAILVDILDALRSYHSTPASPTDDDGQHTILILDKHLHAFPWESLPCLHGHSISRLPSLSCLQTRLSQIHSQKPDGHAYTIPTSSGAYILNPSSDLAHTQSTFLPTFTAQLPRYTSASITARPPTEPEFLTLLTTKSLLLYFGHGSGAQYIRGRRIKSQQQCAVTFLMGCSSSKMTECGVYESYGVPWNYMHGGSMAVVGTLWDVTDRDIDRFALGTLVEWGLLDGETEPARETGRSRGKGTRAQAQRKDERRGQVTLDAAVSRGRAQCVLQYLNGAAVVVYGVPVLLESSSAR